MSLNILNLITTLIISQKIQTNQYFLLMQKNVNYGFQNKDKSYYIS